MWTTNTITELRGLRRKLPGSVGFVPTMGALHEGHASLIRRAGELADHVVVSIFVNPTQFGPHEDLGRYPRTLQHDLELCARSGSAGVFCPSVEEMYPPGQPACEVNVPLVAVDLEGAARSGHFAGVCRVVAKLFNIVQPDIACFGQKDYQQLRVVEAMVADLCMPIRIVACPTVRSPEGLALSSRNTYLSDEQRRHALGLSKALSEARMLVDEAEETDPHVIERAMAQVMTAHQIQVQYAVVRHPRTLACLDVVEPGLTGGVVALLAGRLGEVRLIDNAVLGAESGAADVPAIRLD